MPHRPALKLALLLLVLSVAACAGVPNLDRAMPAAGQSPTFPALVPLGPLLAQADDLNGAGQADPAAGFRSRIGQLNARAAALRAPVISPQTRAQMQAGIDTPALQ